MKEKEVAGNGQLQIILYGRVQGIGFRPYLYQKASVYHITGSVKNEGGAVFVDCYGSKKELKLFYTDIIKTPPKLAQIEKVECHKKPRKKNDGMVVPKSFSIVESGSKLDGMKLLLPDLALCDRCLDEMKNPLNRRYHYAFINCSECGPRYSMIKTLPYDRNNSTMVEFTFCKTCDEEYQTPSSRRFHVEGNCCEACGPRFDIYTAEGAKIIVEDPIAEARKCLKAGYILAIKGIGGIHLACDARNESAVSQLRQRKERPYKPFALMAKDLKTIQMYCEVSEKESDILTGIKKPIVLLEKKGEIDLPEAIAPKQKKLGIMLPYAPMHTLLLEGGLDMLVLTSANKSSQPMEFQNEEAIPKLKNIADYFLLHNRDIYMPLDDSVVNVEKERAVGVSVDTEGKAKSKTETEILVRRGRGYAPYHTKIETKEEIIALGAEQKASFCIAKNGYVTISQYLGDMEGRENADFYLFAKEHLENLLNSNAKIIAYDLHPSFFTTALANRLLGEKVACQHHHAHMVSGMAEHGITKPVIGVVFDGTGYGLDGANWGGEFFVGTRANFTRVGHLEYAYLQGGDLVAKEPVRSALCYLAACGCKIEDMPESICKENREGILQAVYARLNGYYSSSIGRLFDAVSALLEVCSYNTYEGQAAIELEQLVEENNCEYYSLTLKEDAEAILLPYQEIFLGITKDRKENVNIETISTKFHNTILHYSIEIIQIISTREGIQTVVLSGGVFENQYIKSRMKSGLKKLGYTVYSNESIPSNDEGISFGQLHIAEARRVGEVREKANNRTKVK